MFSNEIMNMNNYSDMCIENIEDINHEALTYIENMSISNDLMTNEISNVLDLNFRKVFYQNDRATESERCATENEDCYSHGSKTDESWTCEQGQVEQDTVQERSKLQQSGASSNNATPMQDECPSGCW